MRIVVLVVPKRDDDYFSEHNGCSKSFTTTTMLVHVKVFFLSMYMIITLATKHVGSRKRKEKISMKGL
jgi:hypothetical protein